MPLHIYWRLVYGFARADLVCPPTSDREELAYVMERVWQPMWSCRACGYTTTPAPRALTSLSKCTTCAVSVRTGLGGGFLKSFHEGYFASILALTKGGTADGRKHLLSLGKSPHREVIQQQLSALHPSTLHIARGSNNQSE